MGPLKQFTRKKNAFFRSIKFALINRRYRHKAVRAPFNPQSVKHLLLLRLDDKIGDMVVTTGCAQALAAKGYRVSVLTGPVCKQILAGADYLEKVHLYKPRMSLAALQAERFDAVIDFDDVNTYERFKLLSELNVGCVIGYNKEQYKLFDHSIAFLDATKHISARYQQLLNLFGIAVDHYTYHVAGDAQEREKVAQLLANEPPQTCFVAINPFTGSGDKDFSREQVASIVEHLKALPYLTRAVIIGQSAKVSQLNIDNALFLRDSTINSAVEIVRRVDLVITPDTSIVHIARALDKPLIAVYNQRKLKDTGLPGYKIWAPGYEKATQLICSTDNISAMPMAELLRTIDIRLDEICRPVATAM
ncbi:glycosyltransferase family 9 protein [Phytobacter palmae]|uniref:Glycosyltransferase family 9 protein n=1 Tax=Phytobacter palmae TaxID=1855371 RepID=A0ABU9V0T8_9ENTR